MEIKTYVVTIEPKSAFGTPLKGDTLFGQFCWQLVEDPGLVEKGLDTLISTYEKAPFVVFSSAWPVFLEDAKRFFALPRPELPPAVLGEPGGDKGCAERLKKRKENRAKRWFLMPESLDGLLSWDNLKNDHELFEKISTKIYRDALKQAIYIEEEKPIIIAEQQHNTINRQTMTTGEGMFAPYVMQNVWYMPGIELAIFVILDTEVISIEQVQTALARIGQYGFGRDASTGLGRFTLGETWEIKWPEFKEDQSVFTLAPSVPERGRFSDIYFRPFVRFGKHGAQLLHTGKPFKNPVVMADEGAVLTLKKGDKIDVPWIGSAVTGVSKAMAETVVQGYSPTLPLNFA